MKKTLLHKSITGILLTGILFASCKKDENLAPMRQFMPSGEIGSSSGESTVKLTWKAAINAAPKTKYKVIVSRDTLFTNGPEFTYTTDTSGITLTDVDLLVRTTYYARVQTLSADSTLNSNWLRSGKFGILGEQIFQPLTSNDITDIAVQLKWKQQADLTRIVIVPVGGGTAISVNLAAGDIAAAQKIVSGLTGNKEYIAEIFKGTLSKGLVNFTTKPALTGSNIIDLRGITDRPSVLTDTLPLIADGSTVILKRGYTYPVSAAFSLSKAVTIVSGYDFSNELAVIDMISNFNVAAGSTISQLSFKDVFIKGNSYSGGYIFNVSNACSIGRMSFEGVRTGIFRGMVRLQSAAINITDFLIDNSIIDSVGNYGIVSVDNVLCKIENIAIKNSTIFRTEKMVTSRQNSTSCLIENCTINQGPLGGNYLVDYSTSGTNNVTNGVIVRNTIMGIGKSNAGNTSPRGVRASATTTISSSNVYATSDYVNASNPLPTVIAYAGLSTALWLDPLNGDFKIKDNTFAGATSAGDPRWR
ncbi:DUF5123 domain-containing protein [Terrimonas sp. NA20]|uniref:DUF5123 domain-containing protein n=1 Tax=Terrimonas ginsenosidimutans TaxID=2908004 RepID=A0ABS9KNA7_9BACT|nr:DUF5123 domain-containing protein [Terrimonas ginsenosidimutans]MCG2613812.1 DUF5123 domain-containing protein [Terrimonas ginsenosidimutans]